ncbi:hypothetical protein ECZU48_47970 [Escherichia coli]|nr:hypothetical protein ECZU48_47970 [Escherichia coli]
MWLREQMQQTSQCWTLKELAKISGIAPGAQNGMTGCSGYRWRLNDVPMMKNAAKPLKNGYTEY